MTRGSSLQADLRGLAPPVTATLMLLPHVECARPDACQARSLDWLLLKAGGSQAGDWRWADATAKLNAAWAE